MNERESVKRIDKTLKGLVPWDPKRFAEALDHAQSLMQKAPGDRGNDEKGYVPSSIEFTMLLEIDQMRTFFARNYAQNNADAYLIRWITIARFISEHYERLHQNDLVHQDFGEIRAWLDSDLVESICTLPFVSRSQGEDAEYVLSLDDVLWDVKRRRLAKD